MRANLFGTKKTGLEYGDTEGSISLYFNKSSMVFLISARYASGILNALRDSGSVTPSDNDCLNYNLIVKELFDLANKCSAEEFSTKHKIVKSKRCGIGLPFDAIFSAMVGLAAVEA